MPIAIVKYLPPGDHAQPQRGKEQPKPVRLHRSLSRHSPAILGGELCQRKSRGRATGTTSARRHLLCSTPARQRDTADYAFIGTRPLPRAYAIKDTTGTFIAERTTKAVCCRCRVRKRGHEHAGAGEQQERRGDLRNREHLQAPVGAAGNPHAAASTAPGRAPSRKTAVAGRMPAAPRRRRRARRRPRAASRLP